MARATKTRTTRNARATHATKTCSACKKSGTIGNDDAKANDFYRDKSQRDGFATWCKSCERTYNRAYFGAMKDAEITRVSDADDDARATYDAGMVTRDARIVRTRKSSAVTTPAPATTRTRKSSTVVKADNDLAKTARTRRASAVKTTKVAPKSRKRVNVNAK